MLAADQHAWWVTSFDGDTVTRIDPLTNHVAGTTSLAPGGAGPIGIVAAAGALWVANHDGSPTSSVTKLDPFTLAMLDVIPAGEQPSAGPSLIAAGAGSVWTTDAGGTAPLALDGRTCDTEHGSATNSVASTPGPSPSRT